MSIKRIWIIALCGHFLISAPAMAQDEDPIKVPLEKPAAPSSAPQPPQKFYLELDPSDLGAISTALNELPKKIADPLILKLNGQLQKQDDIRTAAKRAEAAEPERAKKRDRK